MVVNHPLSDRGGKGLNGLEAESMVHHPDLKVRSDLRVSGTRKVIRDGVRFSCVNKKVQ